MFKIKLQNLKIIMKNLQKMIIILLEFLLDVKLIKSTKHFINTLKTYCFTSSF